MKRIFLDTSYLQALVDTGDSLHELAIRTTDSLSLFRGVTSEMVLTELLNALSGRGQYLRQAAIDLTNDLRNDNTIEIISQTSEQFERAFDLYQRRLDKGYSLTDCASMQIMQPIGISEVLTFDKHFQQEGFRALLRES